VKKKDERMRYEDMRMRDEETVYGKQVFVMVYMWLLQE